MSYIDLQPTLTDWPYDADQISVRKILGTDGAVRIQMRVELGVLQMEAEGRPDGARPSGHASLLEYQQWRLADYEQRNGTAVGFGLSPEECQELRTEASLYYRRYIALFVLEEYDQVVRDSAHNLDIFDFCREHAREEEDRACLESYRPYVLMMNARSRTLEALGNEEYTSALAHVNRGIMHIMTHLEEHGLAEEAGSSEEIRMLRELAAELKRRMPQDSAAVAETALRLAVEKEQFEEAARLRDMLEDLQGQRKPRLLPDQPARQRQSEA
ncbi:MAG: UvrB/UvrC motif-containing protein [Planctomycetes bacterium]|nr:UvrB/UvrC motif-containing protein [Planctomycetota bacterium]